MSSSSSPTRPSSCATTRSPVRRATTRSSRAVCNRGIRSSPSVSFGSHRGPASTSARPRRRHEHRRAVRPPPCDDRAGHDGHSHLRPDRLPATAGQRVAQRRLPDDPGQREPAGREPRHDGFRGGDTARKAILDHRRHRFDDLGLDFRPIDHHDAVRARPQHRRRGAGCAVGNRRRSPLAARYRAAYVRATGQLTNAAAYRPLVVAYRNGAPVRLEQLGRVFDSVQNDKVAAWYNGTRGVVLAVQRQPGTNTIEIVDAVRKILPTFEAELPPSINLSILYDRSQSIRASVHDVEVTLLLAFGLVVGVIFAFLRSASATIIPSLALPLSIIGTFALMYVFGYNLDNLSLMALTLCVGFVVDDAIVMLENITRHMEMGKSRLQATLDGAKDIGVTIS